MSMQACVLVWGCVEEESSESLDSWSSVSRLPPVTCGNIASHFSERWQTFLFLGNIGAYSTMMYKMSMLFSLFKFQIKYIFLYIFSYERELKKGRVLSICVYEGKEIHKTKLQTTSCTKKIIDKKLPTDLAGVRLSQPPGRRGSDLHPALLLPPRPVLVHQVTGAAFK